MMTILRLPWRGLSHYWHTNLAVLAGVATAVAVLAGALLVGTSVRASLRELALARLGRADVAVAGSGFFRDALADDLSARPRFAAAFSAAAPAIAIEGTVTHARSRTRAHRVQVVGVDERFWKLQGDPGIRGPASRDTWLSDALAAELGAGTGDALVLTVEQASDIPASVLQGRRDQLARRIPLTVGARPALPVSEFSLRPQQGGARMMFVALDRLQRDLRRAGEANLLLLSTSRPSDDLNVLQDAASRTGQLLREAVTAADLGLRLRPRSPAVEAATLSTSPPTRLVVESRTGYLSDAQVQAIEQAAADHGARTEPVLMYLANRLTVDGREVPYSTVSALDEIRPRPNDGRPATPAGTPGDRTGRPRADAGGQGPGDGLPGIVLNTWAAADLRPAVGDTVALEYYVWTDDAGLDTRRASFRFTGTVPLDGLGADPTLTPDYPGLTDEVRMSDWDPPFPVELSRIRPRDEAYWTDHRAAPKAFVPLAAGRALWGTRFGRASSIRLAADSLDIPAVERAIVAKLDPVADRQRRHPAGACRRAGVGPGHDGFRRVLPLLQLLSGRLRAAAGRAVLSARHRAAIAGGRAAARPGIPGRHDCRRLRG